MARTAKDLEIAAILAPIVIKNIRLVGKILNTGAELDDILQAEVAEAILQARDELEKYDKD